MIWAVVTFTSLLAILIDTAYGYDKIENWPDGTFGEWIVESMLVVSALLLSLTPVGIALYTLKSIDFLAMPYFPINFVMVFPIVLLSMLETNSALNPLSPPVWRSLPSVWRAWAVFYLETAVLVIGGWYAVRALLIASFSGKSLAACALLIAGLLIYFRLLGRLAWCISAGIDRDESPPEEPADAASHEIDRKQASEDRAR